MSFVRSRRFPLVSSLAAAISDVGLDAAAHRLDCEHYPACTSNGTCAHWGVRGGRFLVGSCCWNTDAWQGLAQLSCFTGSDSRTPPLDRVASAKVGKSNSTPVSGSPRLSSKTTSVQFTLQIHQGANSMTNAKRLLMFRLLVFVVLLLTATSWAQSARQFSNKSPRPMASIRGIKWKPSATPGTERLPDSSKLLTSGSGSPRPEKSATKERIKPASRSRSPTIVLHLSSQSDQVKNEVERPFVNDNYWLLFVFHAYWDKSATVTDEGMKKLPMGAGSAELVSVKVSPGSRRLHARRYLGPLRWQRQPRRVPCFPPRRDREAQPRQRLLGRLQKGRSNSVLNRASRHRRRQGVAHLHYGSGS